MFKACGSQSNPEDRWPWPRATAQRTGGALCGGTYMQDVRSRGVGSQQQQAVLLTRAFLVNLMAVRFAFNDEFCAAGEKSATETSASVSCTD